MGSEAFEGEEWQPPGERPVDDFLGLEDAEEEEVSAETELASKLGDLATLWAADRIG